MGEWLNPLDLRRKSVKSETKSETQGIPLIVRHLVQRDLSQVQILPRPPKMIDGYKIVLKDGNDIKTLFHAVNGTKTLQFDKWIKSHKKIVSDGKGGRKYISGFHFFLTKEKAKEYLINFRTEKNRIIVKCYVRGYKPKLSNKDVYLADQILIPKQSI